MDALLSKVLLTFAIDFEKESDLSLAISANVMRVLNQEGVRLKDLPIMTGVSKEAISVALGILRKKQIVVVETELSGGRLKTVRLTSKGSEVQHAYRQLLGGIEEQWQGDLGKTRSRVFASPWSSLWAEPRRTLRHYSGGWNRILTAGEPRSAGPRHCRTIQWCCTAEDSRMVARR